MKGKTHHFNSNYNLAGSDKVRIVLEINDIDVSKHEHVPIIGTPKSFTIVFQNGTMIRERYYDEKGEAYLDIDYTDHNSPKKHPVVPHQHVWRKNDKGELIRGPWEEITK